MRKIRAMSLLQSKLFAKIKIAQEGQPRVFFGCKNFFFWEIRRNGTLLLLEKIPKGVAYVILFLAGYRRK